MKYPVHRIRMWKMRNAYIILVDKLEGKIPFVRPSRVCLLQVKWDDKEYGPVFNDTFLSAVFKLQDQIQKVQREWQPLMALYHHQSVTLITTLIRSLNKGQSHLNQWSRSGLRCWNSYQPTMAVVPGSLVDIDRNFRGASCHYLPDYTMQIPQDSNLHSCCHENLRFQLPTINRNI